jgi:hypothetical protein
MIFPLLLFLLLHNLGPGQSMGVMGVFNSTSFASVLQRENQKFNRLFKRRAMLHHYTEFVDASFIEEAERIGI